MTTPVEIAVIIVVVGFMVVRRLIGEPSDARRMLLLPAVLTVVGLSDISQGAQSPLSIGFLVGSAAISVAIGLLRGFSVRVTARDGVAFMQYTATTVILLATNFAIKIASGLVLGAIDPLAEHAVSSGLALTFGIGMLTEGAVVLAKAVRTGGRILWERGDRGYPGDHSDPGGPHAGRAPYDARRDG